MVFNLVKYILIGIVLIASPIYGDSVSSASGTASSSGGDHEGFITTTHQTGPQVSTAQSSAFASNPFIQGLLNTPGLAGLTNGLGGGGYPGAGGPYSGGFPGMAGFAAPPGSEFGGPGGFVGPSYIPYSWLGSLAGFKGDIIFPLLIIGFVLVGIWTAIQFFMGLIVPWVAAKTYDPLPFSGPNVGGSFSVAKSGSVSGSSRFLRDLGNAMGTNGAIDMDTMKQILDAVNKGQKMYENSASQNATMEAKPVVPNKPL